MTTEQKAEIIVEGNFTVEKGECLVLLKDRGIVKTVVGADQPKSGSVLIQGHDVYGEFNRRLIGYCPKENLVFNMLTLQQNVDYFATIKGIDEHERSNMTAVAITALSLDTDQHRLAGMLSNADRRRLQLAMAIVGQPEVVVFDEPTAGMDPQQSQVVWQMVGQQICCGKKTAIIASECIEEAEVFSNRMGIIGKDGMFKEIPKQIKDMFELGFEIEVKTTEPQTDTILRSVCKAFGSAELYQKHTNYLRFRVPSNSPGQIFELLESLENIEEYSVSQTTLKLTDFDSTPTTFCLDGESLIEK